MVFKQHFASPSDVVEAVQGRRNVKIFGGGQAYRKVASSNMSCLEAHAGFFKLLMKVIFDPYVLTFWQKVEFLISNGR